MLLYIKLFYIIMFLRLSITIKVLIQSIGAKYTFAIMKSNYWC